jgi:hypothetical protein
VPCRERENDPMRGAETASISAAARELLIRSAGIVASGAAVVAAIEAAYRLNLDRNRLAITSDNTAAQEIEFLMQIANNGQSTASYGGLRLDPWV